MFQRKLIVVLSVLTVLAVAAGSGHASIARVEGMGLGMPQLSQFTDDYQNIYLYPASVVRQNNLVIAELGNNSGESEDDFTPSDQSFTLIRNFPRLGVISVQVKQSSNNLYNASSNVNNEWWDVIWGKAFTKMDFAVRFDMANSYYEDEFNFGTPGTYKERGLTNAAFDPYPFGTAFFSDAILATGIELNTYGVTPSVSFHMANDNRLDLAATYRRYTLDRAEEGAFYAPTPEKWEDGGNASYAILARYFMNQDDANQWYLSGWYVNDDLSWEVTNATATPRSADETYKQYGVGISNNMRVNDNNLLIWGLAAWQSKHDYERGDNNDAVLSGDTKKLEETFTTVPILFGALETQATSWLKVRIGATNMINHGKSEFTDFNSPSGTDNEKFRFTDFNLSLGTGIRWNNLDIDMTLNEEFPFTGGNVLSGSEQAAFTRASATYHF
jgi:hypothetical protein